MEARGSLYQSWGQMQQLETKCAEVFPHSSMGNQSVLDR